MNRPRIVRVLRIAWSVAWGVAAVLVVVLWVRSLRWVEAIACDYQHPTTTTMMGVWVDQGTLSLSRKSEPSQPLPGSKKMVWSRFTERVSQASGPLPFVFDIEGSKQRFRV